MNRSLLSMLFALALAPACKTPGEAVHKSVQPDDAAEKLRDQIARAPEDPHRVVLHDQLAEIEVSRARQANTVLSYRRFLEEFPNGDESETVRSLLEDLEYRNALATGTRDAWIAFLDEQPRGRHAIEARNALGAIDIGAALASIDVALVRRTLGKFPDHPKADALRSHEDDLSFAMAMAAIPQGTDGLDVYFADHPDGAHRAEAMRQHAISDAKNIEDAEDLSRARTLAARANATAENRAVVAAIELRLAMRGLDLPALRKLAATKSEEPAVRVCYEKAATFVDSLKAHPFPVHLFAAVDSARPGAGLPKHDKVIAAVSNGDPMDRAAALRELSEWADPDDIKVILSAVQSEYVSVRLQALETLRSLAKSLDAPIWKEIERSREGELLNRELSAATWRQLAALRDADGRTAEAVAAWRAVSEADSNDLAARYRTFWFARQSEERLALGAAARELSKSAVSFAQERWSPSKEQDPNQQQGKLLGMPVGQTILRQICAAIDLGAEAAKALGDLGQKAAPEEQQLLLLAKRDAEKSLDGIRVKRQELESSLLAERAGFAPCGTDPTAKVIEASRNARAAAIAKLGTFGDNRVIPFVEGVAHSPALEIRSAARDALEKLRGAKR